MTELEESEVLMLKKVVGGHGELIFGQRSGSWSFNLSLASSDKDYFGVFVAHDPLDIKAETFDHTVQGNSGDDWVVYELGKYLELLAKGNPKVVEPLFATHFVWASPLWLQIVDTFRPMVVNLTTIAQYLSFASFEWQSAIKKKDKASEPSLTVHGKPLYHALRLARESQRMLKGLPPRVWWDGEDRNELMAIRTGETSETFDQVADRIKLVLSDTKAMRLQSTVPEALDMVKAGEWLVKVRMPVLKARAREAQFKASAAEASPGLESPSQASSGTSPSESVDDVSAPPSPFPHLISRTHHLLAAHGFDKVKVLKIVPIGSQLMQRLSSCSANGLNHSPSSSDALILPSSSLPSSLTSPGLASLSIGANHSSTSAVHGTTTPQDSANETQTKGCNSGNTQDGNGTPNNASDPTSLSPSHESSHSRYSATSNPQDDDLDWLIVFKLPVADIVNPLKQAASFYFEKPQKINVTGGSKYGCGIWAIEIESALSNLSRHHVVFEALAGVPNDARCGGGYHWRHGEWAVYEEMLESMWREGTIVTFGLVSHYLGVVTGLLKSSLVWPEGAKSEGKASTAVKEKVGSETQNGAASAVLLPDLISACGVAQQPATSSGRAGVSELSDASCSAHSSAPWPLAPLQLKAYRLALRLYTQSLSLLPTNGVAKPSLLSPEQCLQIASSLQSASASASTLSAAKDALITDVAATQATLKRHGLTTDLPKLCKAALAVQLRRARDSTLDWD